MAEKNNDLQNMNNSVSVIADGVLHDTEKLFANQLDFIIKLLDGNPDFKRIKKLLPRIG